MGRSYLDNQCYEEVCLKLQGKALITPQELESLKIMSASSVMEKYRTDVIKGEQHGKKTFLLYVEDVLEYVSEVMIKKRKKDVQEEKQTKFVMVNKFLIDRLQELIDEIRGAR